jgi:hypothetical protein
MRRDVAVYCRVVRVACRHCGRFAEIFQLLGSSRSTYFAAARRNTPDPLLLLITTTIRPLMRPCLQAPMID